MSQKSFVKRLNTILKDLKKGSYPVPEVKVEDSDTPSDSDTIFQSITIASSDSQNNEVISVDKIPDSIPTPFIDIFKNDYHFENEFLDYYRPFFREMVLFRDKKEEQAPFSYFNSFWPTYSHMDKKQRAYYFYWRRSVLDGIFPETDSGYLKLLVYEILSGLHWSDPMDGYKVLIKLWNTYGDKFPSLRSSFLNWIFDFSIYYNLSFDHGDFDLDLIKLDHRILNHLIDQQSNKIQIDLPFEILEMISDYKISESRFYSEETAQMIRKTLPKIINLADRYYRKIHKVGLFEFFRPLSQQELQYKIYPNAVTPYSGDLVELHYYNYFTSKELSDYITALFKYGENILREKEDFRGRLRVSSLQEELKELIRTFILEPPIKREAVKKEKKVLDLETIRNLRSESDIVREVLEVEEAEDENQDKALFNGEAEEKAIQETSSLKSINIEESLPFDLEGLTDELKDLLSHLEDYELRILVLILKEENTDDQIQQIAEMNLTLPDLILDDINNKALDYLDDILLEDLSTVSEEYYEELVGAVLDT